MIKSSLLFYTFLFILTQSQVIQLTQQTFQNFTTSNPHVFLYFYSPSSMKCLALDSEFGKLSQNINDTDVQFAKIDATTNISLSEKYGVRMYPSLFFFDYTFVLPYKHDLSYTSLENWIRQYLKNRVQKILPQDLPTQKKPYIIIQQGADYQIRVLNQSLHGIDLKAYSIGEGTQGKIKLSTRTSNYEYHGDIERIQLSSWINQHMKTIIIQLDTQQIMKQYYFGSDKPALVIVLNEQDKIKQELYDTLLNQCNYYKQKINCVEIRPKYPSYQGVHTYFETQKENSIIGLVKQKLNIAYLMPTPSHKITQTTLHNFIEAALSNTIKRLIDNVPSTSIKFQQVKILSEQNLTKTLQHNHYVFINYYKSNKQNCIEFSRKYQILANIVKEQSEIKDILIASFDCTKFAQQCYKRQIKKYPTLKLYINNIPIDYDKPDNQYQVPDFVKFLTEKKSKTIKILTNTHLISNIPKPFLLFQTKQLTNLIKAYPATLQLPCYYLPQPTQLKITLHLDNQILTYPGQQTTEEIKIWIKLSLNIRLVNIMTDGLDQRIVDAINDNKFIFILLNVNQDNSQTIKSKLGLICYSLSITGAYIDSTHDMYPKLLNFISEDQPQQSKLLYYHLKQNIKYEYPYSLTSLTKQSIQSFVSDVQTGRISHQKQQDTNQDPIIEQL